MPSPQQITWFIDLANTEQLNLDPPYQRKSVWTLKDRKFFLDTIFKNYPCPAIFIHKITDEDGKTTYNVVDGKQRLQTILMFKNNELTISKDFGDTTLDGKTFKELTTEQKRIFWDYILVVDFVDLPNPDLINEVFDRLNRNAKNLNEQELRHAKYSGWFLTEAEKETENPFWESIKISTKAKNKRMKDVQFISELLMVILEKNIVGFDQDHITELYAKYDNPLDTEDTEPDFEEDSYINKKEKVRRYIEKMEESKVITKWATTVNNFYTLWSLVALNVDKLPSAEKIATKYDAFMEKVESMNDDTDSKKLSGQDKLAYLYYSSSRGASTDLKQRSERLDALKTAILVQ